MTTHITKTWFDGEKIVTQEISESEVYQQEPVAWICEGPSSDEKHDIDYWQDDVDDLPIGTQLYTTPLAAQRPWVGLTDEDVKHLYPYGRSVWGKETYEAIEKALKDKNT